MFQNGQRVCFRNGGDPARIQKVQIAYGKDRQRAPRVIPTNDLNATQVQVVTGADAARYPFIDPIGIVGAPAAWFRQGIGVTVTGSGVSSWADQSGNGRDLLQGTDASRPPYLSYSGTKYLYCPGVNSNNCTTPDSAANSITGPIDLRVRLLMADWTPAADVHFLVKGTTTRNFDFFVSATTGVLGWYCTVDGVVRSSTSAPSVSDGSALWVRVTRDSVSGDVKFYTAADSATEPTSWTQLGNTVSANTGALTESAGDAVYVGSYPNGTGPVNGRIYRAIIKNGIDGTTVVDFNPNLDGSDQAASFTSSATGEVWTINKSGGLPAQIVGRPSLLFDGTADYLACNTFTLNQPETVYLLCKAVSWTNGDAMCDGNTLGSGVLQQITATPQIRGYAGNQISTISPAVGTYAVIGAVFNGASSVLFQNLSAAFTGNGGASNMSGFYLGASPTPTNFGNIQVLEAIIFPTAHDATTRARVIQYLAGIGGVSL